MQFAEEFLHYIWKYRLFSQQALKTISGLAVEILNTGIHNHQAGPDFEHSRIRIGDTTWAGNTEIHLRSSDWEKHHHQLDKAYNNVILHVVYLCDKEVVRENGTFVQQLCLKELIPDSVLANYHQLMIGLNWIPCEKQLKVIDPFHVKNWLSRILIERLERKTENLKSLLNEYHGNWDESFYVLLARNFGFKTNALPFELLARSLPSYILAKHKNNILQIEALVFGQAGFLDQKLTDHYPLQLKKEYVFLKKKYSLQSIDHFTWKYMRLRPTNFPGIRLAQFAALIFRASHLFSRIIEINDAAAISKVFSDLPINSYWNTHYRFQILSSERSKQIGLDSINIVLINTVVVSLFAFGKHTGQQSLISRAIEILEHLPPENNNLVKRFSLAGFNAENANHTQALIQLKQAYCDVKKCLHCGIGIKLLKR